jgi:hypothetical protein
MKLDIDTFWDLDSLQITSEVKSNHDVIIRNVMNTRDEGIRRALIALGWTPPDPDTVTIKRGELEKLRIAHYSCEDNWYSCPKSEDGCCNDMWDECNCGADKHNAILETALGEKK